MYSRITTVDPAPAGDTTKASILDLDTDLTGEFANLNTHEGLTTAAHGVGAGSIVGTTLAQSLSAKTLVSPTITGSVTASGATISSPAITGATLYNPTLTGTITGLAAYAPSDAHYLTDQAETGLSAEVVVTANGKSLVTAANYAAMRTLLLALGSDADGDMYYRASGVLTRLAKGTANLELFMNAAGTAPEWASGVMDGSFTRDMTAATGTVNYALSFRPSNVLFIAAITTTYVGSWGKGNNSFGQGYENRLYPTNNAITLYSGDATEGQAAVFSPTDSGFSLTWTKTGTPAAGTATIIYMAFR